MELTLYTVVHPIHAPNPWKAPEGWRWAIHTDDQFHQVDRGCILAGWEPSQSEAEAQLSQVLIGGRRMLTAAGQTSSVVAHVLADCPLTAEIVAEMAVLA